MSISRCETQLGNSLTRKFLQYAEADFRYFDSKEVWDSYATKATARYQLPMPHKFGKTQSRRHRASSENAIAPSPSKPQGTGASLSSRLPE